MVLFELRYSVGHSVGVHNGPQSYIGSDREGVGTTEVRVPINS